MKLYFINLIITIFQFFQFIYKKIVNLTVFTTALLSLNYINIISHHHPALLISPSAIVVLIICVGPFRNWRNWMWEWKIWEKTYRLWPSSVMVRQRAEPVNRPQRAAPAGTRRQWSAAPLRKEEAGGCRLWTSPQCWSTRGFSKLSTLPSRNKTALWACFNADISWQRVSGRETQIPIHCSRDAGGHTGCARRRLPPVWDSLRNRLQLQNASCLHLPTVSQNQVCSQYLTCF